MAGAFTGAACASCSRGRALSELLTPEDVAAFVDADAALELGAPGDPLDEMSRWGRCDCARVRMGRPGVGDNAVCAVWLTPPRRPDVAAMVVYAVPEGGVVDGHFVVRPPGARAPRGGRAVYWLAAPQLRGGGSDTTLGLAVSYREDLELRRLSDDRMATLVLMDAPYPRAIATEPIVWDMVAGAGKTTRVLERFTHQDLYICPTNALLQSFQAALRKRGFDVKQAATYERALAKPLPTYDTIYVDEAFTLGAEYVAYVAAMSGRPVVALGDRDQCGPHHSSTCRTPIPECWAHERTEHTYRFPEVWCEQLRTTLAYSVEGDPGPFTCTRWAQQPVDMHIAFSRDTVRYLAERGIAALSVRESQGASVKSVCLHVRRDGTDVALAMTRDLAIVALTRASDALYLDELEEGALRAAGLNAFLDANIIATLKDGAPTVDRVVTVEATPPPPEALHGIPEARDLPPFCPLTLQELVFGRPNNPHYSDLNRVDEGERKVRYMRIARHTLNHRHEELPSEEAVLSAVCAVRRYRNGEDGGALRTAVQRQHPAPDRKIPPPRVTRAVAAEWRATYLRDDVELDDVYTQMGQAARELTDRYARRHPEIFAWTCTAQSTTVPSFLKAVIKCVDAAVTRAGDEGCAAAQTKGGLEIRAWAKDWVLAMSPHFRAIQKILLRACKEHFHIAAGHSVAETDAWWQAHYTPHAVEVDFTEFDRNQTLATRDLEVEVTSHLLGFDCLDDYKALRAGSYCQLRDLAQTETGCERTSGEPATLLHNTVVGMAMAMRMVPPGLPWAGIFQGDDMVLFFQSSGAISRLKWQPAELKLRGFNIPVKHLATPTPSFCGCIGTADGLFVDVMHLAVKLLCRKFEPELQETQAVAMLDRLQQVYVSYPATVAACAAFYGYTPDAVRGIVMELTSYGRLRGVLHPHVFAQLEYIATSYARRNLHDAC
uniref:Polyprotein n=1 Tax=Rumple rubivirus TaxID=2937922 RepID=A0A9N6YJ73_9VIRU|nr:TPA_asm: polyprotein [Rumple rubivirus]